MRPRSFVGLAVFLCVVPAAHAQNPPVTVNVDAAANQHPISPLIYGVNFGDTATLSDLGATVNRNGGNSTGRYNWLQNIDNRGVDYYFESIPYPDHAPGEHGDTFISDSKAAGAQPFLTMPMVGWVAKTNAQFDTLCSFSVSTYGAQTDADGDCGNGCAVGPDVPPCYTGTPITFNDPNDASIPADAAFQQGWMQHVFNTWGPASGGGLKYWGLDNEPSIWWTAYWDVRADGAGMDEITAKMIDYGGRIRTVDAGAQVLAPEEWGWDGYFYSGMDQQLINQGACGGPDCPDRLAHGGMDYVPYLLTKMKQHEDGTGQRVLDMLTLHFYPQGGEFDDPPDVSPAMQLLRNRSTRGLWDPNYLNESWINDFVQLIPRMKAWVATYYPGLPVGLTEYNWGAPDHINGATAQADVMGILGREGADMATRWLVPEAGSPVYNAFKMYRNYDGAGSTFGDTSVAASGPNPDDVAAFAATRASDGALTIMVISKVLSGSTPATINLATFAAGLAAHAWRLTASNVITQIADVPIAGNSLSLSLPLQSITLLVVPAGVTLPTISIGDVGVAEGDAGTTSAVFTATLSAPSGQTVSASFATADGTATAGQDYVAAAGTVSFPPGITAQPVSVDIVGDTVFEGDETFVVNLSNPVNGTIGDGQGLGTIVDDDPGISLSSNELTHGAEQRADLLVGPDYYRIGQAPHASYEVVIDGTSGDIVPVALDRLAADGTTVLQSASPSGVGGSVSLRWQNTTAAPIVQQTLRVNGSCAPSCGADDVYRIRAFETTYRIARFNNAGSQVTVLILQNPADYAVAGTVWFWDVAGTLLGTHAFALAPRETVVLNTASVPGVASQGGAMTVSHDGHYGDMTGKTVALEPATGFSFDSPMLPAPR
jgi:glycosyl hydrolase family 44/Calx-beta domain-containing protein